MTSLIPTYPWPEPAAGDNTFSLFSVHKPSIYFQPTRSSPRALMKGSTYDQADSRLRTGRLGIDSPKREGLIPDIKLGTGARLKLYGFFKTSIIHDSSSPQGNDFPLPLLAGDTGPGSSPEFHRKVRAFRFGANFEWLEPAPKTVLTGKIEFDFEGNFARSNNRNISSIRSSQPSIRLAWVRIDRRLSENMTGFVLLGQDWTLFVSSTLPKHNREHQFGRGCLWSGLRARRSSPLWF